MGLKDAIRRGLKRAGYLVVARERLGVDALVDIARLCGDTPVRCVFDVGANRGQMALAFATAFPRACIHSFEPVPQTLMTLRAAVRRQPRIHVHGLALGAAATTAAMALGATSGESSLQNVTADETTVTVSVDTVDAVAARLGVEAIDLLKLDVEGHELAVLDGAATMLARGAIRFILAECVFAPDPRGRHTLFADLHARLDGAGFAYVAAYAEGFELAAGRALANVLYVRRAALPARVPGRVANVA